MTPAEGRFRELSRAMDTIPSIVPNDYPASDIAEIIRLYSEQPLPVDKLPYSRIFDAFLAVFNEKASKRYSAFVVFGILVALRKQERLPLKKG